MAKKPKKSAGQSGSNKIPGLRTQVEGLKELQDALKDFPPEFQKRAKKNINQSLADRLYFESVKRVPVGKTGELKYNLKPMITASYAGTGVSRSAVPYANFVHWGANGWPKQRGDSGTASNAARRRNKKRQYARDRAAESVRVPGTLFIWKAAAKLMDPKNLQGEGEAEGLRIILNGVRKTMQYVVDRKGIGLSGSGPGKGKLSNI